MKRPDIPKDEPQRLAALNELEILDTPAEERFDRLTRLARNIFNVPIALITLIDANRQWFKSCQGISGTETARDISFCGHAILDDATLVIEDATQDERFADNPVVIGEPYVRFYAGAPLKTKDGFRIGTLCVIDSQPRNFTAHELGILRDLADSVEEELIRSGLYKQQQQIDTLLDDVKTSKTALYKEQRFNTALLNAAGVIIVVLDPEGRILRLNPAAEEITGYRFAEVKNQFFWTYFLSESEHKKVMSVFHNISKGNLIPRYENHWRMKDGSLRLFDWTNTVQKNDDGSIEYILSIGVDITEQRLAQSALQKSEERLRSLFELSPIGIALNDFATGDFVELNDALVAPAGYTKEEFAKLSYWDITPKEYEEQEAAQLEMLRKTGRYGPYEKEYIRKDGTRYPVLLNGMLVKDSSGKQMIWSIIEDISQRKYIEKMKDEFISTVSHELRTPLTSISGAVGLVMNGILGKIPQRAVDTLKIAQNNTERLTNIINDLLDIEKLTTGKMELSLQRVNLVPQLEKAIVDNQPFADKFGVNLKLEIDQLKIPVEIDIHRFQQVLTNLISNGVKFSAPDSLVLVKTKTKEGLVRVEVIDAGAGISEQFHDKIFQRFAQADSSDTRKKGGTGLGLAISRELVEKMNGSIGFHSVEGKGSTFYIEMPVAE